ncbi:TSUP family transporter [Caballeronia sp. LZ032]|uniref:TSUP family transporter n=1 Tax=Caballeronia sp. LZ032 TaxID=3038565 RepID=UPI0038D3E686
MATSLAVIALVSAYGVIATAISRHINWPVALPFAAGALSGMLAGRFVASRLSANRLQQGFAFVTGLIAVGMVLKVAVSA